MVYQMNLHNRKIADRYNMYGIQHNVSIRNYSATLTQISEKTTQIIKFQIIPRLQSMKESFNFCFFFFLYIRKDN